MNLQVNGKPTQMENNPTLEALLTMMTGREVYTGIAVAINGELIQRQNWNSMILQEGDNIEILQAVAGG